MRGDWALFYLTMVAVALSGCFEARPASDAAVCAPLFSDTLAQGDLAGYEAVNWGVRVDNVAWKLEGGALTYTGGSVWGGGDSDLLVGDPGWTEYAVEARVTPVAVVPGSGPMLSLGLVGRYQSPESSYRLVLHVGNTVQLFHGRQEVHHLPLVVDMGQTYRLRLELKGDSLKGYLDGELLLETAEPGNGAGRVGLYAAAGRARFTDLSVYPLTCR